MRAFLYMNVWKRFGTNACERGILLASGKKILNGTNGAYQHEHEPKDDSLQIRCQVLQKACLEQLLCELQDVMLSSSTLMRSITMRSNTSEFAISVCTCMHL